MRFLADESCDFAVIAALRAARHDVLAVHEFAPGAEDLQVIGLALREERVLLTEDKDFGQLVFAHGQENPGVVLLRFPASARERISRDVVKLAELRGSRLKATFTIVQPGRIRISHA